MEYKVGDVLQRRYEVVGVKYGGFGVVYICSVRGYDQKIAIKSFQDKFLRDERTIKMFYKEAEVWVKLGEHRNIVRAHVVQEIDYKPHVLIEYIDGGSLKEKLEHGRLSVPEALYFGIQFCDGMIYANTTKLFEDERGIVHRDIKPNNIMLTRDNVVKITDFGLVRALGEVTMEEMIAGTPPYMSPEQFLGGGVEMTSCSDIYSFGVTIYEMLTRVIPFNGPEIEDYAYQHRYEEAVSPRQLEPTMPVELEQIVLKCLKKNPKERYQSFNELKSQLMNLYIRVYGKVPEVNEKLSRLTATDLAVKGLSLRILGRLDEAIKCYDEAISFDSKNIDAWGSKGIALSMLGKHEEALKCFDRVLWIDPRNATAWGNKGSALALLGRFSEALDCYDEAIKILPYAEVWLSKGTALRNLGSFGEALQCYDKALEINPKYVEAWSAKGNALEELGRNEEAVECYDKAVEINPRDSSAWYSKGHALASSGRLYEAIECYDRALELNPRYILAWIFKGAALTDLGRLAEALNCCDKALEIDPKHKLALELEHHIVKLM